MYFYIINNNEENMKLNPVKKSMILAITLGLATPSFAAVTIYPGGAQQPVNGFTLNTGNSYNNYPQQQQNQVESQPAQTIPQSPTNTQQNSVNTGDNSGEPGSAYDQGYGSEDEEAAAKQALEDYIQFSSPRQLGQVVEVPTYKATWKNSRDRFVWYANWKGILTEKVGVDASKVDLEASRLTPEQFDEWANRQLTTLKSESIDVNNP